MQATLDTAKAARAQGSPFWLFARRMLHYRLLVAVGFVMVLISGLTLGAGMLGAKPVLQNILGARKDLPAFATEFNAEITANWPWLGFLTIPEGVIRALPTGPWAALVWIMAALAVITVIGSVANFLHAYLSFTVVNRTVTGIRREAFHAVLRAPLRSVIARGPSDAISRIVNDSTTLLGGLSVLLSKAVLQIVKGVAGLAAAIVFDWRVTFAALLVTPGLYTIIRKLGKRIRRASGAALESQAGLYAAATESLQALRVVKVHTTERYEGGRFHRINKQVLKELNRVRTARALASPLTEMLSIFLLCGLVLAAGWFMIKTPKVEPTDFILAIIALAVAGASLKPLTGIINDIQGAAPAADRLMELLNAPAEPGHGLKLPRLAPHSGAIEFENVSLSYPGASVPAINGVSLTVSHGKRFAFVGPNGSGKTTLLGLVARLFDPDSGRVLVDGRDIREVSVRSLRSQIGMVTQETILFRGTIRSNIAYGSGADDEQVFAAARMARAHDFITALPQGYDTPVAEQGLSMSGGQRQRIAIARAILRDPAILVLDEATSMIDADSEAQIAAALMDFSKGRTCLMVAHRLSTVLNCDCIVVLDQGRIVDQGTHEELLARCELYRSLAQHGF